MRRYPKILLYMAALVAAPVLTAQAATASPPAANSGHEGLAGPMPGATSYLSTVPGSGRFPIVEAGHAAPIVVSSGDYDGVVRVVGDLAADIERVTAVRPAVSTDAIPAGHDAILVGTIGHSPLIDKLIAAGKLDVSGIAGKWETSLEQVVQNPVPGLRRAFVIAGSNQRGTIYGAYDVSRGIGVSPWYWWDDVAPKHQDALYALPGRHTQGTPAVKYRGFFINDENPDTGTWAPAYFGPGLAPGFPGGLNHNYWAKVFEVALRLKANYIWPAVWGRAFAEDDPQNQATANAYGIVMGTSHEAPMTCGIEEWNRHAVAAVRDSSGNIVTPGHDPYGGTGEWSYRRNQAAIEAYWTKCFQRMITDGDDMVVTLGMRGNGDVGLPDGDGIDLMQSIIAKERQIIADVSGKDPATIPQVWTLYKEVQRYWDKGLRAPDDVTIVFTDDNWGNVRKLPDQTLPPRSGGYGLYYHFDYVGGGRNYKWVDTANLANTWEQLRNVYSYGDSRLWVANVGDMKNDELPLQFFLDYAWNPAAITMDKLSAWEHGYAAQNFGEQFASGIADVLHQYGALQSRRKPELLNRRITVDSTGAINYDDQGSAFSVTDYRELDNVTAQWQALAAKAERINGALPAASRDAYYELVLYAVKATANLYALRDAEFTNIMYAAQGRAATNDLAAVAEARFADDQALSNKYNTAIAGGKWNNWQLQPHIDYGDVARYGPNAPWQQPELNNVALPDVIFPAVKRIDVPAQASLGVAIDGSDQAWPGSQAAAVLPAFSPYQSQPGQYIDVFNRGATSFGYQIQSSVPWVSVSPAAGTVDKQVRASVRVDWSRAPAGTTEVPITVTGAGGSVTVKAEVQNPSVRHPQGFVEANGYVAMLADHYTSAVNAGGIGWQRIPDITKFGAGMTPSPVTAASLTPGGSSPRLDYRTTLVTSGQVQVCVYVQPRNPALSPTGLQYGISLDGAAPQVVNITTATGANDGTMNRQWERNTSDNTNVTCTTQTVDQPGVHTVSYWMVDPTVILQRIVVNTTGAALPYSYLGPPESMRVSH